MKYKNMMAPIESILAKKKQPVSMSSGLLSPAKPMEKEDKSVQEKIAGYVALIRKQRQEFMK